MKSNSNKLPYAAATISAVVFGLSFIFTKSALDSLSTFQLLGFRFMTAALVLTALKLAGLVKIRITRANIKDLLLVALFQPVLYFIFETIGIGYTSASLSSIIISLVPISITFFAVLILKERLSLFQWISISVSVMGVVLIVLAKGDGSGSQYMGIFALIAAVAAAGPYNVLSRKVSSSFKPAEITFVMMWVGAVVFNVIGVSQSFFSGKLNRYFTPITNMYVLADIIYLGVVSSIVAFFLLNYSLSKIEASKSGVFMNITPIVSVIAGILLKGERLYPLQFVGAVLILTGIWGANRKTAFEGKSYKQIEKL